MDYSVLSLLSAREGKNLDSINNNRSGIAWFIGPQLTPFDWDFYINSKSNIAFEFVRMTLSEEIAKWVEKWRDIKN